MQRLAQISSHLYSPSGVAALQEKRPDDVVVTMAIRSPLTRANKGALKDTPTDELMFQMFKQAIARSHVDPASVGDICLGTILTPDPAYHVRAAALAAGFPESVPIQVVNRFCGSGLMTVAAIANEIRVGEIEIGLAVGFESMSQNPDKGAPPQSENVNANSASRDCRFPMGWTAENVAKDYSVSREDMDAFAALSFQRAERAQKSGYFTNEIVPFNVFVNDADPATGVTTRRRVTAAEDDGIKYGTTKEALSEIRPAWPHWGLGRTTSGNASQVTDGVSAVMLMTRRKAEALGLEILGKYISTAVAGAPPRVMGIGPVYAVPKVLENTGLTKADVDLWEINEAFASQYVYCVQELGLDLEKVNVNGGAIAFGHPGARQVATGLHELKRRNGKVLVTSMCIGTGMGAAAVFVRDA